MSLFKAPKQESPQIIRSVSYPQRGHTVSVINRPEAPQQSSRFPGFLVIAGLLVVVGFIFGMPNKSEGEVKATSTAQVEAKKPIPPKKLDYTAMDSTINAVIQKYPYMDIGVATIDIKTGDAKSYGVQNPFVAASTAKLLTAIAYLHDVEQGKATLDQKVGTRTAQEALKAMIIDSDNVAWNDFNNTVMSHAELAEYATSIGLDNYDPDKNTITPTSIAKLLGELYQEKVINAENTKLLLSYMAQAKEVEYITNTVPTGTKVFHKPGYLNDRIHDVAVIDNGSRPYVLVIFTKSRSTGYNAAQGEDVFTQITKATLSTFSQ